MIVDTILKTKGSTIHIAPPDAAVAEIVALLAEKRVGALVISADGKNVDGIVSERDIISGLAAKGVALLETVASDLMSRNVVTCGREASVAQLMAMMTERRIRHLPVVEDGVLCGMVSIGDVVKNHIDEIASEAEALREYITRG